jgi:hypothetical protein
MRSSKVGRLELFIVSPIDLILDRYARKVDISDERWAYEPSATITHPAMLSGFGSVPSSTILHLLRVRLSYCALVVQAAH